MEGLVIMDSLTFWNKKKVFLTGHTGFKGAWLSKILTDAGAELTGYALAPPIQPSLYALSDIRKQMHSIIGDIRDMKTLACAFNEAQPEIVIHMAAQPLVRVGYTEPRCTYEANVMGTVNILECVRLNTCVKSLLNVTTDKVYYNDERNGIFAENQPLDGFDPYSNSKSCSELVTHSYKSSFFADGHCAISTARAGNVIGGGDFAKDRIIPDCIRFAIKGQPIIVRNPYSTRPYQHVLEALFVYLMITAKQYKNGTYADWYNVGPDECDCLTTGDLVSIFCEKWGNGQTWENHSEKYAPHEASFLRLTCRKLKQTFGWMPRWNIRTAVEKTVEWSKKWQLGDNMSDFMARQIKEYTEAL